MKKNTFIKFVTTIAQNTVQNTSVRISTSYYSSTRIHQEEFLPNILAKLSLRLGNSVVSISNVPREKLQAISRNICQAILIYHDFISARLSAHEQDIQMVSASSFFRKHRKKYSYGLEWFNPQAYALGGHVQTILPPSRLNLDCSPNVRDIMTSYSICLRQVIFLIDAQLKKLPQDGSQLKNLQNTCQNNN